jgi:hypothetical protein
MCPFTSLLLNRIPLARIHTLCRVLTHDPLDQSRVLTSDILVTKRQQQVVAPSTDSNRLVYYASHYLNPLTTSFTL